MLFSNSKKSVFTRVESLALSISQWCILDLLPEEFKGRNVFFMQVTVLTVPVSKLKNGFKIFKDQEYKAIQIKAYFTTIDEDPELMNEKRPSVSAEMLFCKNSNSSFSPWEPDAFILHVNDYPYIYEYPYVGYFSYLSKDERLSWKKDRKDYEKINEINESRRERLESFLMKFRHYST